MLLLIACSFNGYAVKDLTLSSYYEDAGLSGFSYERPQHLFKGKEILSDDYISRSVSYSKVGILDFEVERENINLLIEIDYNYGELNYTKTFKENIYQTGTLYFPSENIKIGKDLQLMGKERIFFNKNNNEKRGCGSQLKVLDDILILIEGLIDNGVSPQSPIIGSLMNAAILAMNSLMSCMRK